MWLPLQRAAPGQVAGLQEVPEMYVYYGTNDHNFEKLADPPAFEPTRCAGCNRVIKLATDGYSISADGTYCMSCRPL
jgi:hypothetical protein